MLYLILNRCWLQNLRLSAYLIMVACLLVCRGRTEAAEDVVNVLCLHGGTHYTLNSPPLVSVLLKMKFSKTFL